MNTSPILVVCLNPTFQKTLVFNHFEENEVNRCSTYRMDASGKGMNVARIITQIGGEAMHLTHLGGSRMNEMISLIEKDGIDLYYVETKSAIRTCTTIINKEKNTTTELVEEPYAVDSSSDAYIRILYSNILSSCSSVVISGTRSPGYSPSLYSDFVKEAKEMGKTVILDIKGEDLKQSLQYYPDVIKPNLSEFISTYLPQRRVNESDSNEELKDEVILKMKELFETYHCSIVITRGKYPIWVYSKEGFNELATKPIVPVNTIGCGDALTSGIAYHLLKGDTLIEAVKTAITYSAKNATLLAPGSVLDNF